MATSVQEKRTYDFIVYGATGFTGQFVCDYLARAIKKEGQNYTWAAAGRNEYKVKMVLRDVAKRVGDAEIEKIPVVVADSADPKSLLEMARQARCILNCVGPYRFFGEPVVEAAVSAGTHIVDISGEPQFLEKMQLKYDVPAREKGIYVVGACGFDSIPGDMGHVFLADAMGGDVNSVEMYLKVITPDLPGAKINFGTWQSAIYGLAMAHELKPLRKSLYPERMPQSEYKLAKRPVIFDSEEVNSVCIPFLGSDKSVMTRTQRFRYHRENTRPTQINCYYQLASKWQAYMFCFVGIIFGFLAKFAWGRKLLENYPSFFSGGVASKEGPSMEMITNSNFIMTLVGKGWSDKAANPSESPAGQPDKTVKVRVQGKNVGYGATCEMLVQSAMVILTESNKMPGNGGCLTPGYAFAKTSLVERLNENGVWFKVNPPPLTEDEKKGKW